jgi:hypothetical protein
MGFQNKLGMSGSETGKLALLEKLFICKNSFCEKKKKKKRGTLKNLSMRTYRRQGVKLML